MILGGGNRAHTITANFTVKGHTVNLYEMPEFKTRMERVFETKTIECQGEIKGSVKLNMVTDDIVKAIDGVDYICVITPAFAHANYAELLKGKVSKYQVIVTFPGAFASLQFRKIFGESDCPVLADVNNLPYDTRLVAAGKVEIYGRNAVNIAFLPANAGEKLIEQMKEDLFPFEKVYGDVLECYSDRKSVV